MFAREGGIMRPRHYCVVCRVEHSTPHHGASGARCSTDIAHARRALQAAIAAEKEIIASITRARQAQTSA